MINYGIKLRAIRNEFKLTQNDFANKLGMKQSAYSMLENNTNGCSLQLLEKLFKNLKINPRWFFLDEGDMFHGAVQQPTDETGFIGLDGILAGIYLVEQKAAIMRQSLLEKDGFSNQQIDRLISVMDGRFATSKITVEYTTEPTKKGYSINHLIEP